MMIICFTITVGFLLAFLLTFLVRTQLVYNFRIKLIDIAYRDRELEHIIDDNIDINRWKRWDLDITKKVNEFHLVSYDSMVIKFWKPLKSFYKGTELLKQYEEFKHEKMAS